MDNLNTCHMTSKCDNCIHKPVCSKYIAMGEVNSCEHHKEERKGKARPLSPMYSTHILVESECPFCRAAMLRTDRFCPMCGADMKGD